MRCVTQPAVQRIVLLPNDQSSTNLELTARVVIGVDEALGALTKECALRFLSEVLCRRAKRLSRDKKTYHRLREPILQFIHNVVDYFRKRGILDDYTLTNLATALICADDHGPGNAGIEDYSTFIRRLNPIHRDTELFFILGREGSINDPQCPLGLQSTPLALSRIPATKLHMYLAFYHARSMDETRGAPRIPVDEFFLLIPEEITSDPNLKEAFLDICFSDGAWELYQRVFKGGVPC